MSLFGVKEHSELNSLLCILIIDIKLKHTISPHITMSLEPNWSEMKEKSHELLDSITNLTDV